MSTSPVSSLSAPQPTDRPPDMALHLQPSLSDKVTAFSPTLSADGYPILPSPLDTITNVLTKKHLLSSRSPKGSSSCPEPSDRPPNEQLGPQDRHLKESEPTDRPPEMTSTSMSYPKALPMLVDESRVLRTLDRLFKEKSLQNFSTTGLQTDLSSLTKPLKCWQGTTLTLCELEQSEADCGILCSNQTWGLATQPQQSPLSLNNDLLSMNHWQGATFFCT